MVENYISTYAQNVTLSTPANKKCWIPPVELINFARNTACNGQILKILFQKNVLLGRFFMPVIFLIFSLTSYANTEITKNCVSTHFDETVRIDHVIDGDTVILSDNRHIRLIGINTPEISHDSNKRSDAGAKQARTALRKIINGHKHVQLYYDKERFDKHGRTLAHLFLMDGINVQETLLRMGWAMPIRIAPNLSFVECYLAASQDAKDDHRGIWELSRYQPHSVSDLLGSEKGFYYIAGEVKRVSESRTSLWINLENNVALRILKDDLHSFSKNDLMSLTGKTIEAGGWLYRRNKQLRMRIRHNLDLNILN